ncbi:hypothetical protein AVEN_222777-1 [Araneus ventricosus]|uniref:Uncharacterized protein n=1 Tax=Araneus ventricosus TaxID=182803 RepID=A0A4Y2AZ03_ARAVE|nr:hypothetical protein AVEN_222777-1 [Araneus ventricosus]
MPKGSFNDFHFFKHTHDILCTVKIFLQMVILPVSTKIKIIGPQWWPGGKSTRGRRVPGSKPDYTEEPPCKRVWSTLNPSGTNLLPLIRFGEEVPARMYVLVI